MLVVDKPLRRDNVVGISVYPLDSAIWMCLIRNWGIGGSSILYRCRVFYALQNGEPKHSVGNSGALKSVLY